MKALTVEDDDDVEKDMTNLQGATSGTYIICMLIHYKQSDVPWTYKLLYNNLYVY